MSGKRLTPAQQTEAITLREAGYTRAVIAERLGVSISSLQRLFKRTSTVTGSVSAEAIEKARESLLERLSDNEALQEELCRALQDDLAHIRLIREQAALAAEYLNPTDLEGAAVALRGLVGYSTLLKNTTDVLRQNPLMIGAASDGVDSTPELTIRVMTDDEIAEVQERQEDHETYKAA